MSKTPAVNPFAPAPAPAPAPTETAPATPPSAPAPAPAAVVLPPPPNPTETAPIATVRMVRNREVYPKGPWTADVHPDEVKNYSGHGWNVAE